MKKTGLKRINVALLSLTLLLGGASFIQQSNAIETPIVSKAWSGAQVSNEGTYYSSISASLTGDNLKAALKNIISGAKTSYDWSRYEAADEMEGDSSKVLQIYARTPIAKSAHFSGSSGWNREHTYPQSKMSAPATSDNHIIFADDNKTNGTRGNNRFKDLNKTGTRVVDSTGAQTNNYSSGGFFEPNDAAKGEVARATLYANVLYGYSINNNFYDTETAIVWALRTITNRDIYRNNKVHTLQGNRNPFVDHPEYTCRIWGNTSAKTQSLCSGTPISSETPSSSEIPSSSEVSSIPPSSSEVTSTPTGTVSTKYMFTSEKFAATSNGVSTPWTLGQAGLQYLREAVQVNTAASGAFANSPVSFVDIKDIVISYATNSSKGAGTISVYLVDNPNASAQTGTLVAAHTVSSEGGTTFRDMDFINNSGKTNGYVQIHITCTENSIYVQSATINVEQQAPISSSEDSSLPPSSSGETSVPPSSEGSNGTESSNPPSSEIPTEPTHPSNKLTPVQITIIVAGGVLLVAAVVVIIIVIKKRP